MMSTHNEQEIIERLDRIEQVLVGISVKPLTLEEAAEYLHISTSHLYKLTSKGKIPHYKPEGKKVYFDKSELDAWLLRKPVRTKASIEREAEQHVLHGSIGSSRPYQRGTLSVGREGGRR